MIEKLEKILARYDELGNALADPATLSDMENVLSPMIFL